MARRRSDDSSLGSGSLGVVDPPKDLEGRSASQQICGVVKCFSGFFSRIWFETIKRNYKFYLLSFLNLSLFLRVPCLV